MHLLPRAQVQLSTFIHICFSKVPFSYMSECSDSCVRILYELHLHQTLPWLLLFLMVIYMNYISSLPLLHDIIDQSLLHTLVTYDYVVVIKKHLWPEF